MTTGTWGILSGGAGMTLGFARTSRIPLAVGAFDVRATGR